MEGQAKQSTPTAGAGSSPEFEKMSIHQLKEWLTSHGVDMTGEDVPIEKEDLVELARGHHLKHNLGHAHTH